ncbi:MAG: exo-alpha-sialidase [Nitrospira sp.]|nr:exo-alpha-sialidase [Nitrospira sp.]
MKDLSFSVHTSSFIVGMVALGGAALVVAAEPGNRSAAEIKLGPKQTIDHAARSVSGPSLKVDERGTVHITWMEEDKKEVRSVRYARILQPGGPVGVPVHVNQPDESPYWRQEAPALAVNGEEVFVTWALSHPKAGPDKPFTSELRLSRSIDGGQSFQPSVLVNDDNQVVAHSFDSLHIGHDGTLHIAWIDGRDGKKDPGTYATRSTDHGQTVAKNRKIDEDTCVCCRTALSTAPDGTVYLAWRKILEGNIRETVVAYSTDGGQTFSSPVIVGHDRWVYAGCPHRPASLGVDRQGRLYVVWYTEGADETPAIYLAYSDDQGRTFSPKQALNASKGTFPDHPQMAVDGQGRVVVVWEEQSPVRREVVMRYSFDRGQTFSLPIKLNEKKGQSPVVAMNNQGFVALAWMEHAMLGHKTVLQTLQLPQGLGVTAQN